MFQVVQSRQHTWQTHEICHLLLELLIPNYISRASLEEGRRQAGNRRLVFSKDFKTWYPTLAAGPTAHIIWKANKPMARR